MGEIIELHIKNENKEEENIVPRKYYNDNPEEIYMALQKARQASAPSLIACRTTIGYGAPTKAGTSAVHGSSLGEEEIFKMRKALNWSSPAFEVPGHILNTWRSFSVKGEQASTIWKKNFLESTPEVKNEIERRFRGELPQ